ncbi:MAG: pantoate kinase [Nanoarchaeota archaeon]|nr:pantoate kinase [Nanoarchaeota archaeon]
MIKAFAPGNLSCIFIICPHKDPKKMGSLGVGIATSKGVIVSVMKSGKIEIRVNNKRIRFPTVSDVVNNLAKEPVEVRIKYQLPYGCGFGMSGASALATSYALNRLFDLRKSKKQLAMVAHVAEVRNRTGLGDVGGQYNGNIYAKYKKGNPLEGVRLPIKDKFVYYKILGPLDTKKVITNDRIKKNINKAGLKSLKKIKSLRKITLKKLIEISKEFSVESNLLVDKRVKKLIESIENKGNVASMVMLGNAVYSDKPFIGSKKLEISRKGAYVLST